MPQLIEGDLVFDFPGAISVQRFDGPDHGMSHCMQAVDFVVEYPDSVLFVEVKDPEPPKVSRNDPKKYLEKLRSGTIDQALKTKYRDTFLYLWCEEKIQKPIDYAVMIALTGLGPPMLLDRMDALKRLVPAGGGPASRWKRYPVRHVTVFNIEAWNKHGKYGTVSRVSQRP